MKLSRSFSALKATNEAGMPLSIIRSCHASNPAMHRAHTNDNPPVISAGALGHAGHVAFDRKDNAADVEPLRPDAAADGIRDG